MRNAGRRAHVSGFFRTFLIQASWNYRTMLGGGFAFAILPVLRKLYQGDPLRFQEALRRHAEHFNAHPYLANLALGAVIRMEEEGRSPEEIRRFKVAVRGALGGLGDVLVWVGWRPTTILAALLLAMAGASPAVTVCLFLVVYNLGHLTLRIWGYRVGLERGSQVGDSLRSLALPRQADRLASIGVFLLGGSAGLALGRGWEMEGWAIFLLWVTGCVWGFWIGSLLGQRSWKWIFWGVSAAIGGVLTAGWFG
jgi:mannose/fructose/N-acetylgalactosamine-specific phosphotransferase system component IID